MKAIITSAAAALALASLTGCGEYYYEGRAPAYGNVAYTEEAPVSQAAVSADVQAAQGQDVVVGASGDEYSDTDPSALSDFRTTLDPYGAWVEDGTYGTVWVPSTTVVGADFVPYQTAGHWAYGDDYVWVSDYEWGWAPFHYGRWVYIGDRGWGWIPGRTYAGAWVSWRTGYDGWGYVGWAPLPPSWYWRGGVAYGIGVVPYAPYTFCATGDLFAPSIAGRVVAGPQVGSIAQHTRPYTAATPSVGGRTPATPSVGGNPGSNRLGPPPTSLGINPGAIAHAPPADRGLMRAQQFAHASTATSLGARAPVNLAAGTNFRPSTQVATGPAYNRPVGTPSYRGPVPSYSTRSLGNTYNPSTSHSTSSPSYSHSYSGSSPSYSHSYSTPSYSHSYSAPSYSHSYSAPSYSHSSPSYGGGSTFHSSGGGSSFHSSGGGSVHSFGGGGRGGGRR